MSEKEVNALRRALRDVGVEAGTEASGSDHAGVGGFRSVGHHDLADLRTDTVGTG
jgi:hypothetical protein